MADVRMYVRGRRAKKADVLKSERMRHMNSVKNSTEMTESSDHSYYDRGSDVDRVNVVVAHVEVRPTPWFGGRRIVELDVLSEAMSCTKCNSWLRLHDILDESKFGLVSLLYIRCSNSICQYVNAVPTGKRSDNKSYDVNSKAYFGNYEYSFY